MKSLILLAALTIGCGGTPAPKIGTQARGLINRNCTVGTFFDVQLEWNDPAYGIAGWHLGDEAGYNSQGQPAPAAYYHTSQPSSPRYEWRFKCEGNDPTTQNALYRVCNQQYPSWCLKYNPPPTHLALTTTANAAQQSTSIMVDNYFYYGEPYLQFGPQSPGSGAWGQEADECGPDSAGLACYLGAQELDPFPGYQIPWKVVAIN